MSLALRLLKDSPRGVWAFPRGWDRWFDDFYSTLEPAQGQARYVPACDVEETETHYVLSFDMPGVAKEDVNIEVEENTLKISGEKKSERKEKKNAYHVFERRYGSFERAFRIPEDADVNKIEANHENGVLRIALEKGEKSKPRQIKISEDNKGFFNQILNSEKEETN